MIRVQIRSIEMIQPHLSLTHLIGNLRGGLTFRSPARLVTKAAWTNETPEPT